MIFGALAALASGGLYPLMFLMYGRVAGTLVDYSKPKFSNLTSI